MGRGASNAADLSEITDIISTSIASTQVNNSTLYDSSGTFIQISANTEECVNDLDVSATVLYQTSSSVFASTNVMQTVYANIMNSLTATQDAENTGGLFADADNKLLASISNVIQSTITAESIMTYTNDYVTTTTIVQACVNSSDSTNTFIGTKDSLISELSKMYSSMVTDQGVSATVANYLSADQTAKTTGLLAILIRGIMLICIVIVVIVAIVIGIIVMSYLKS